MPSPSPARSRELQLAPGIYFTPARSSSLASAPPGARPVDDLTLSELRAERAALLSSIDKLRMSNREMLAFDPARRVEELVQAVGENVAVIARRVARAEQIADRINLLCPGSCETETPAGRVPEPSADGQTPTVEDPGLYL